MNDDIFVTPYSRPNRLSDPYNEYNAEELSEIINMPDENLTGKHLSMLFHGALAAGNYQESCYFLPYALKYVKAQKKDSCDALYYILYWTREMYIFLVEDGVWIELNKQLYSLFRFFTRKFLLIGNSPMTPKNDNYVDIYLDELNHFKYLPIEITEMQSRNIEVINKFADAYLRQRFSTPDGYDDWAWLIFLINGKLRGPGLSSAYYSDYLQQWVNSKSWHNNALPLIIEYIIKHPEHESFWTRQLDNAMIF
ncbi:MAG: hypothetical protein AB7F40_00325 [Victivallaceae bacterium]|nr:hypothetical protein [Victivallaceae bacterium]